MWDAIEHRLALLELLQRGVLRRRKTQAEAFAWLVELPWTRATGRHDQVRLVEDARADVLGLLDRVWPDWREAEARLTDNGVPPTPKGWRALGDAERAEAMPRLPERLNLHTALALLATHSKASMSQAIRDALGETELTRDGTVRLRPPPGLRLVAPSGQVIELDPIVQMLGEVAIPERAMLEGVWIEGDITAVLTVENLGAFQDLTAPDGWLVAFVPGWNTAAVRPLLAQLEGTAAWHFGDIDPNGLRVLAHLRQVRPDLGWFVPDFWQQYVEGHAQSGEWTEAPAVSVPEWVAALIEREQWLEQEVIVLDERLEEALRGLGALV
jgi:hypothetical protein